jgi:hypothetical protein
MVDSVAHTVHKAMMQPADHRWRSAVIVQLAQRSHDIVIGMGCHPGTTNSG